MIAVESTSTEFETIRLATQLTAHSQVSSLSKLPVGDAIDAADTASSPGWPPLGVIMIAT